MRIQRQHTEYNVSQLGLISIQGKLPDKVLRGWESVNGDSINGAGIRCISTSVVPHGIAGDVFSILVTAAVAAREGQEDTVRLTVSEIAKQIGLSPNVDNYDNIKKAIFSLQNTNYDIWNSWTTPLKEFAERLQFSLIHSVAEKSEKSLINKEQRIIYYEISLDKRITESIEGSLTLITDASLLAQLNSPNARGLYRMLEAFRRDPNDFNHIRPRISLTVEELVECCRLFGSRQEPARLLAQLQNSNSALPKLIKCGYIKQYNTEGKGWDALIDIEFCQTNSYINTKAMALLVESGISGKNASTLASLHSMEEVEASIWEVEQKLKIESNKIRNPPGLIVTTLKSTDLRLVVEKYKKRKTVNSVAQSFKVKSDVKVEPNIEFEEEVLEIGYDEQLKKIREIINSLSAIKRVTPEQSNLLHAMADTKIITLEQIRMLLHHPKGEIQDLMRSWSEGT